MMSRNTIFIISLIFIFFQEVTAQNKTNFFLYIKSISERRYTKLQAEAFLKELKLK